MTSLRRDAVDLHAVIDRLPAMVAYWDADCRNRYANQAYVEWFGYEPDSLRGVHIRDLLGPTVYSLNRPYIDGALAGTPQSFERALVDTAGRTRHTHATYTPHVVDGTANGFLVLVTDISTRVLAETRAQEDRARLSVSRDRLRLATALQGSVIERLFGLTLELESGRTLAEVRGMADMEDRLARVSEGLDEALGELRSVVFAEEDPHTELTAVIEAATTRLGFAPVVDLRGSLDTLPAPLASTVCVVVREALRGVALRSDTGAATVTITAHGRELLVVVSDDGAGPPPGARFTTGSGVIQTLAEEFDGTATLRATRDHGTVMEWRVPIAPTTSP